MSRPKSIQALVVEDHPLVRQGVIKLLLEEWPACAILECTNAQEARRLLEQRHWDFVLLDQGLPDGKGLDLVELAPHPRRVLVISVDATQELMHKAHSLGCGGFVAKSDAPAVFLEAAQAVITGKRHFPRLQANAAPAQLSEREQQVCRSLQAGASPQDIAAELNITYGSVQTYKKRIFGKLGVCNLVEFLKVASKLP